MTCAFIMPWALRSLVKGEKRERRERERVSHLGGCSLVSDVGKSPSNYLGDKSKVDVLSDGY